jgi:outer membrane lipoprotein-sorting protein
MRWSAALALLCLTAPAYCQENEGEKLFRAMEKKVRSAKALQVTGETEIAPKGGQVVVTAKLYQAPGNKGRLQLDAIANGKSVWNILLVSDGKTLYSREFNNKSVTENIPPHLQDTEKSTPALLARVGAVSWLFITEMLVKPSNPTKTEAFDVDKAVPAKGFKLAGKEKIGPVESDVVEYVLEPQFSKVPLKATVWIDAATHLPVKRQLDLKQGNQTLRISETYREFILDAKLDAKLFEIPN